MSTAVQIRFGMAMLLRREIEDVQRQIAIEAAKAEVLERLVRTIKAMPEDDSVADKLAGMLE